MKKLCSLFALVFLFVLSKDCFGQESQKNAPLREGGLYLHQGFRWSNFNHLNKTLESYGFRPVSSLNYSSGAGGYGWLGRFKLGGEGIYFQNQNENSLSVTKLKGFGGNIYTAYLLNPNSKLHILPLFGDSLF